MRETSCPSATSRKGRRLGAGPAARPGVAAPAPGRAAVGDDPGDLAGLVLEEVVPGARDDGQLDRAGEATPFLVALLVEPGRPVSRADQADDRRAEPGGLPGPVRVRVVVLGAAGVVAEGADHEVLLVWGEDVGEEAARVQELE